ncbi:DUF3597 domain-containing protein [Erythrobacteraceae bacterium CFH 75059]|uniref:DUF3597 domain-containing protein n=1 Tax=Qipengyuania thermophila TaxID=2509361 RepID=UPI001021EC12|nr:DUF3597 domain-containing protein [Qipengyuania thermophila]TCD02270.1 DUF3597 domain-containing protein [Erythrobacteraceae bacterium CFH 75059]
MGIFGSIKNAIFATFDSGKGGAKPGTTAGTGTTGTQPGVSGSAPQAAGGAAAQGQTAWAQAPVTQPSPASQVDVEQRLDSMPGADKLNWRTSIVDLMKLLGIDSSYENRKELAQELGRSNYSGSAEDNLWLHKRTMQELAANGGKVPAQLLD